MIVKTFSKGLFYTILGIGVLGFFAGLALAGSDIVNPWTSQANAAQTRAIIAHETEKNNIDLHYYAQERILEAVAQESRINNDLAYHQRMSEIKLTLADLVGKVAIYLSAYLLALFTFLFFWHRFHKMVAQKEASVKRDPKYTPVYLRPQPASSQNGNGRVHNPTQNSTIPTHPRVNA